MENKLYRDEQHKVIGGVCAGLSNYLKVDTSLVRVVFVLALLMHGVGLLAYIILWIVLPAQKFINPFEPINMTVPPLDPQTFMPSKRSPSSFTLIFGLILIMFGGYYLLRNFDIVPDFEFTDIAPVVIIMIGVVLIFGSRKQKQWQATNTEKAEPTEQNDNPETV